jgi:hypothetical protein
VEQEVFVAKGQKRGNREVRKPKTAIKSPAAAAAAEKPAGATIRMPDPSALPKRRR